MGAIADQNLNLNLTTYTTTGTQNDYNPTGFANVGTYRHDGSSTLTMTGLVAGRSGRVIALVSNGVQGVDWLAENAGSSAANRFSIGESGLTGVAALLWYDPIGLRWIYMGDL